MRSSSRVLCFLVSLVLSACLSAAPGAELYQLVARQLDAQALPEDRVGVPARAADYFSARPVVALPGGDDALAVLAQLAEARPAYVVAASSVAWEGVRAQPWFTERYRVVASWSSDDVSFSPLTLFAYRPTPFDRGELVEMTARFAGDTLVLRAYRATSAYLTPGLPYRLTLYWDDVPGGDYRTLTTEVAIVDPETERVWSLAERHLDAGDFAGLPGYRLTSHYTLALPDDLPQGAYRVIVRVRRQNGAVLPVVVGGQHRAALPLVAVSHPPDVSQAPIPSNDEAGVVFGAAQKIALAGYDAPVWALPGDPVRVALVWAPEARISEDLKVFVHLLDREGRLVAQADGYPVFGFYPTTQWQPGDYVRDEHILALPDDLLPGHYRIAVGLYVPETGARLAASLPSAGGGSAGADSAIVVLPDDRVALHDLRVW